MVVVGAAALQAVWQAVLTPIRSVRSLRAMSRQACGVPAALEVERELRWTQGQRPRELPSRAARGPGEDPAERPACGDEVRALAPHHVQLAMAGGGEGEARGFYGGLLGLAEVAKPPHSARRGGVWFEQGEVRLHLGVERPFAPARKAHPAFLVAGLAGLRRRLERAGCAVSEDEPLRGFARFYVADPLGSRVELLARAVAGRLAVSAAGRGRRTTPPP